MDQIQCIRKHTEKIYAPEEYPSLMHQFREWSSTKPLSGRRILDGTPLFTNTLLKYVPLMAAGAEVVVSTDDLIPYDPAVIQLLEKWGIPHVHNDRSGKYDVILDCGGVHSVMNPVCGFAELTRSGYYHFQDTAKPVILVDSSRIKAIETCLGTGDGFYRGMQANGYTDFSGKTFLIFGCGKVGKGIAYYCRKAGGKVMIADKPGVVLPDYAVPVDCSDRTAVQNAVRQAWCVVTATGIQDAMTGNGAAELLKESSQIVAAMGIENEWGDTLPEERILNHGKPLNFLLEEPTRLRYIEPTMALSNAAALELVQHNFSAGIRKIDPAVEQIYWNIVEKESLIAGEVRENRL